MIRINFADVIAVESKQNYILIHTSNKNILTYLSLTEMARILAGKTEFMQLHRSYIINSQKIDAIDGNTLQLNNGLKLTVGDNYKIAFETFVSEKIIKVGKVF